MTLKERKSNFELLRIFAILLIISFHYVLKGGYEIYYLDINTFIMKVFTLFGELGVNLFILIMGYFMITEKASIKRVILLISTTFFYNLINVLLNHHYANAKVLTDLFFPVILCKYWFITAYIIVYLLSPYLNKLIKNIKKIEFQKLLFILIIIWSIIPTIFGVTEDSTEKILFYTRLIWFIIMYFIGAYIRLYDINLFKKKHINILFALISFLIMSLSIIIIYHFKKVFYLLGIKEYAYFWTPNNILMLTLSVSIFHYFKNLKIKPIFIINLLASTTLGIYMIHDGVFNHYIWDKIFYCKVHLLKPYFIIHILYATVLIFMIGALIDLTRQFIEKYTILKLLNSKKLDRFFKKIDGI